jgi:uncharacterized protein YqcC (DUF446 family)
MMKKYTLEITNVVDGIEIELRRLKLWKTTPPRGRHNRKCAQPLFTDNLEIGEWLQWVLIPCMRKIISENQSFPTASEIYAYAANYFADISNNHQQLLRLIKRFDQLINSREGSKYLH